MASPPRPSRRAEIVFDHFKQIVGIVEELWWPMRRDLLPWISRTGLRRAGFLLRFQHAVLPLFPQLGRKPYRAAHQALSESRSGSEAHAAESAVAFGCISLYGGYLKAGSGIAEKKLNRY